MYEQCDYESLNKWLSTLLPEQEAKFRSLYPAINRDRKLKRIDEDNLKIQRFEFAIENFTVFSKNTIEQPYTEDNNILRLSNEGILDYFEVLAPIEQTVVRLKDLEFGSKITKGKVKEKKKTFRQIAEILNIPKSTIGDIHKRALDKLRKIISEKRIIRGTEGKQSFTNFQNPCTRILDWQKQFGDKKTVCPGVYSKKLGELTCPKVYTNNTFSGVVNAKEAAKILGKHLNSIHRYIKQDKLDAIKVNGKWQINLRLFDCKQNVFNKSNPYYKYDEVKHINFLIKKYTSLWLYAKNGQYHRAQSRGHTYLLDEVERLKKKKEKIENIV